MAGDHKKIRQTCRELGLDKKGGYQQHRCYMKFEDQCRYKYLLNSASSMPNWGLTPQRPAHQFATHAFGPRVGPVGYANKLKYLFLTGSVCLKLLTKR